MKALIDGRATLLSIEWHGPLNKRKKVLQDGEPLSWFKESYQRLEQTITHFSYLDQPLMVLDIPSIQLTNKTESSPSLDIMKLCEPTLWRIGGLI